jgi:hypothetical protein
MTHIRIAIDALCSFLLVAAPFWLAPVAGLLLRLM